MGHTEKPIAAVVRHVETASGGRAGRLAMCRWTAIEPAFACWPSAAGVADSCRSAPPVAQDGILQALLRAAARDDLARLTIVSGLSRRLVSVTAGWARAGIPGNELLVLEADLVAECWATVATLADRIAAGSACPPRLGLFLVDRACETVRVPRRRERRDATRQVPWGSVKLPAGPSRTIIDRLAFEIAAAVRSGRITASAARPVFLTRVAGFDVAEAAAHLGCSPAVVRALRSRAERQLAPA
jgi:DNA-directed RNA polymerase specialized sigma24 family protein